MTLTRRESLVTHTQPFAEVSTAIAESKSNSVSNTGLAPSPAGLALAAQRVAVLATLPPPVTGMTMVTKVIVDALQARSPVRVYSWSDGKNIRGTRMRLARSIRSLVALSRLVHWRRSSAQTLYTVLNSRAGLYFSLLTIATARLLGFRCVVHHHVYAYIRRWDWRVGLINRMMGASGTHVVLGPEMERDFVHRYGDRCGIRVLPNTFMMPEADADTSTAQQPLRDSFRLGHLSNLTIEKGLGRVIETFARLAEQRKDISLVLAGPITGSDEQRLVDDAQRRFGDRVEYLGPLYGAEKAAFFEQIDVFLFPTRYRNEAQPLVLLEALASGKPVIEYGYGCIPSLVGADGGQVIPTDDDFVSEAAHTIESWMVDPELFHQQVNAVHGWATQLRSDAQANLNSFVDFVFENGDSEVIG